MPKQYTEEQLNKVYEKLPRELQEAIVSIGTSEALWKACERHNILDKRYGQIGTYVGYVLLGLLLPSDFQKKLEEDIKLPKKTAEEIAREINRFVFYPVRSALEQLHKMEIEVSARVVTPEPSPGEGQPKTEEKPRGEDTYREPIE